MEEVIYINSPIGSLEIKGDDRGVSSIKFIDEEINFTEEINCSVLKDCVDELNAYFSGSRKSFNVKLNPQGTHFQKKVWDNLIMIPYGETISYSELAERMGDIKSLRAVGGANAQNKIPIIIPCHRVIGKDKSLMGFGGGLQRKEWLLRNEGVLAEAQLKLF